jgi:hypothetical protein
MIVATAPAARYATALSLFKVMQGGEKKTAPQNSKIRNLNK